MVHTGFHKAWTASGLHTEVISYLQVLSWGWTDQCAHCT